MSDLRTRPAFGAHVRDLGLHRRRTTILQVNVGKRCNQACSHCHVEAGPKRTELMERPTLERLLALLDDGPEVGTVDLTGGAPELNPHFRWFVRQLRARELQVIDRCNLTVLSEPGQGDTAAFLAEQGVKVVASMPCYSRENVERQRGSGVFARSIDGLRQLNALGYGRGGELELDLVYNPGGAFLPPSQAGLERDYKQRLDEDFGIVFDRLLTITNMPIARYADWLRRRGELGSYLELLVSSFNAAAAEAVMCRDLVSVGWDGQLYDCDFNQMLDLPLGRRRRTIWDIDRMADLAAEPIAFGDHCWGCTAGAGSSCGGALA